MSTTHASAARRASDARAAGAARSQRRFDDALRSARRADAPRAGGAPDGGAPGARRATSERSDRVPARRRDGSRGEDRAEPLAAPGRPASPPAPRPDPAGAPSELRAVLRALPVTIEAARVREGAPLALELGRALSVELRAGRDGLELVLRPDAALSRAAAAELPGVVRALRARGVAVARAEVRARPHAGSRAAGGRVDAPPGVG
jgi:hypothetical protein